MEYTSYATIESRVRQLHSFFATRATHDLAFRLENLRNFRAALKRHENNLAEALWTDLHKSFEEAYLTEISLVSQEIDNHIRHLKKWTKPVRVKTPLQLLPSRSRILHEPLGVSLIIAPWNYPVQLLLNPLVGAISSGCCAMLKPSPYTPSVALAMEKMISETFDPRYIAIAQGRREVNQALLEQRFDMIFFTGSPDLGRVVMQAAARNLTPVVLELGGKSPCIVDIGANLRMAGKRIAWGKCINAGQSCIAPDYLFVHRTIKDELLTEIRNAVEKMYGKDVRKNAYFPRIVNAQAMERLQKLMQHGRITYGGEVVEEERYIGPTLIEDIQPDFPVMHEEIFGPLLPVLVFDDVREAIEYINLREKPLAFYYFGKKKQAREILSQTSSGGGCINDTMLHIATHHLPFGGVGNSGMQKYHGHDSFLAFSNARSLVHSSNLVDLPFKYPPYPFFKGIRKIV